MRVLLLGATGNLGLRLIPALVAHGHTLIIYVRNIPKLHTLVDPSLTSHPLVTIVLGDALDSARVKEVLVEYEVEGIINTAGTLVPLWKGEEEFILPKIARSVSSAAVEVGKERGTPLRAWFLAGMGLLDYPGTQYQLQDYLPHFLVAQHIGTHRILSAIPTSSLRWSILGPAFMRPAVPTIPIAVLPSTRPHKLLISADTPPNWQDTWVRSIPVIGLYINQILQVPNHTTELEDVADFLAEDLEVNPLGEGEGQQWSGKRIGMKARAKAA